MAEGNLTRGHAHGEMHCTSGSICVIVRAVDHLRDRIGYGAKGYHGPFHGI